jgi:hypothetical protein
LRDFGELDEGLEYVGNVIESIQETNYFAFECGWEMKWFKDAVHEPRGNIIVQIARLVREFDGARYAAVAFSKNTNSYYVFVYPSKRIYHLTRSDAVYYHLSRDDSYILSILEEERALSRGEEGSFETIGDVHGFILDLDEEEAKEIVEEGEEWVAWLRVQFRYVTRRKPPVCAYVIAEFSNPMVEYKAWRRVDLSSLCIEEEEGACYESLARQFLKP